MASSLLSCTQPLLKMDLLLKEGLSSSILNVFFFHVFPPYIHPSIIFGSFECLCWGVGGGVSHYLLTCKSSHNMMILIFVFCTYSDITFL